MNRPLFILICGLALSAAAFGGMYVVTTAHSPAHSASPELTWLKQEYQLTDEQYTHVCQLYAAYHPKCLEMCRQIDEKNARLKQLLAATNVVTPEIKETLAENAQLRAKCQATMLNHFYAVSQIMSSEQGRRYLAWMQSETLIPSPMSTDQTNVHSNVP